MFSAILIAWLLWYPYPQPPTYSILPGEFVPEVILEEPFPKEK
jgi:hypothetical protein